ncbi:MAG: hypothetical protein AB8H86_17230 [Polyangiales bacterium]
MSTERKLLRAIMRMEADAKEVTEAELSKVTSAAGISPTELRELFAKLFRKGYVTSDRQTTAAGRRVATRPLGQVLLRRQPRRQVEPRSESQTFTRSTKIPLPVVDASVIRASRNTSAPAANPNWLPPAMVDIRQLGPPRPHRVDEAEAFADVRESELEELKRAY